jgi:hypothetical protein
MLVEAAKSYLVFLAEVAVCVCVCVCVYAAKS